ncbi:hypothetical protein WJX84_002038 [Apatococcus fuscideae]|uniref:Uncharacterized protein n=1 Tax=Apatococcus fuscideae TaxID=2026836 RepID=A0AAW1TKR4_9CHLO
MRQSGLLARWCKVFGREHSLQSCRQAEAQCRAFCGCSHSSSGASANSIPTASSWQSPLRPYQPQQPQLRASSLPVSLLQHHHYASKAEDSLIEDEAEVRELGTPRVKRVVDEIVSMNLLEVADLTELLQERLGLGPSQGHMQPMQYGNAAPAAPAAAAPAAAEPVVEKTEFNVKLDGFEPASKIKVIKEVRAITGLGLKEAKEMVEKSPVMLKESLKKEEAEELKTKLEAAGAKISLD